MVRILLQQTMTSLPRNWDRLQRIQGKPVEGTETFWFIRYEHIPADRRKEITYTKVVCKVRLQKYNLNRTQIIIGGKIIIYPGDVATPTASLEIIKMTNQSNYGVGPY